MKYLQVKKVLEILNLRENTKLLADENGTAYWTYIFTINELVKEVNFPYYRLVSIVEFLKNKNYIRQFDSKEFAPQDHLEITKYGKDMLANDVIKFEVVKYNLIKIVKSEILLFISLIVNIIQLFFSFLK